MTEAGWTRERPSKEGWYWFRNNENCESVVQVYQHVDEGWFLSGPEIEHCTFDEIEHDEYDEPTDCEWLGPITPDSYQQGRVDTLKKVTRHFDNMFGATDRRIDSVRDYRVDKFYTWLAQAAQDEKGVGDE